MDVLSDVLRVVRLSGAVFFTAECSTPWAIDSPMPDMLSSILKPDGGSIVLFHILMEGECIIECKGLPSVKMDAGDVVIFPHCEPHTMRSHIGAKPVPVDSVLLSETSVALPRIAFGGGGETSRFLCGYLNCSQKFDHLSVDLPKMLLVRSQNEYGAVEAIDGNGVRPARVNSGSGRWLATTLKFSISEAKSARPGNAAMLGRLTELMFVEILRQYMQQLPSGQGGWLAGLNDPHVGKALQLIHANPAYDWTVEELARGVAISRSVLAERFTDLVGEPPMRYLAGWRVQVAKQLLRDGATISDVSARVGYESEAAFNRAFKRSAGIPPASWRRKIVASLASLFALAVPIERWLATFFAS